MPHLSTQLHLATSSSIGATLPLSRRFAMLRCARACSNPSLGVDAVHVTDGPRAAPPPPPHPGTEDTIARAMPYMKGKGVKACRCRAHHRPHLHRPCAIDLSAKSAAVGGALTIVARDYRHAKLGTTLAVTCDALAAGTRYVPLRAAPPREPPTPAPSESAHAAGRGDSATEQHTMTSSASLPRATAADEVASAAGSELEAALDVSDGVVVPSGGGPALGVDDEAVAAVAGTSEAPAPCAHVDERERVGAAALSAASGGRA